MTRRFGIHGHLGAGGISSAVHSGGAAAIGGGVFPDWWDPNSETLCIVAAYRAINTPGNLWPNDRPAIYADTLVNNANPGVNDLTELNGVVPWAVVVGWQFNALAIQAFDTGILPDQDYSMLVQYANYAVAGRVICGVNAIGAANGFYLQGNDFAGRVRYYKGTNVPVAPIFNAGNLAISNLALGGYRNGVSEGGAHAWAGVQAFSIYVGARNNGPAIGAAVTADIESLAIYDCILTDPQIAAVATAMAAL